MAWNSALPGNAEKIRNLGNVIRPNWLAIEEGDETKGTPIEQRAVLLGDRSVIAVAADPTVVGATTYLYSKKDTTNAVQEAFIRNAAGNIIQVSQGSRLGSDITDIGFETLSHDEGTTSYNEDNFITAWITVAANGTSVAGGRRGLTSTRNSLGTYTITFDTAQLDTNYGVIATTEYLASNPHTANYDTKTTGSFRVLIKNQNQTSVDLPFSVMVMGGR